MWKKKEKTRCSYMRFSENGLVCGTGSPTISFQQNNMSPRLHTQSASAPRGATHVLVFVFKLAFFGRRAMQRIVRRTKKGSLKKGLLDWVPSSRATAQSGIQRTSWNRVWYCKAGTTDSSCCQQSFFSGPNSAEALPTHWGNRIISGEMTAEWTALWCFPAETTVFVRWI